MFDALFMAFGDGVCTLSRALSGTAHRSRGGIVSGVRLLPRVDTTGCVLSSMPPVQLNWTVRDLLLALLASITLRGGPRPKLPTHPCCPFLGTCDKGSCTWQPLPPIPTQAAPPTNTVRTMLTESILPPTLLIKFAGVALNYGGQQTYQQESDRRQGS